MNANLLGHIGLALGIIIVLIMVMNTNKRVGALEGCKCEKKNDE